MSTSQKIKHEIKALGEAMLYFALWVGMFIVLKKLVLAEYHIEYKGLSKALIGVLILSKVVLILEYVPLGSWTRNKPAWVDVVLRTLLYTTGVFVVMLLEKSFDERHESGGIVPAISGVFHQGNLDHVMASTLVISCSLLVYNTLSIVRGHLGNRGIISLLRLPRPNE